jgi:hypothetical protein
LDFRQKWKWNDEIHVVVVDEDGGISGVPGTILETYSKVSKASDAKDPQGNDNYYPNVIYTKSQYIIGQNITLVVQTGVMQLQAQHLQCNCSN